MPARDYGDLSQIALEADLDPDELRARLAKMSDRSVRWRRTWLNCGEA
jgi:hypothetical protein